MQHISTFGWDALIHSHNFPTTIISREERKALLKCHFKATQTFIPNKAHSTSRNARVTADMNTISTLTMYFSSLGGCFYPEKIKESSFFCFFLMEVAS
jgi:hypothetical protein